MTAKPFSLSLDPERQRRAVEAAKEDGRGFSAYVDDLIRRDLLRRNGRKYRQIMDNLPADEKAARDQMNRATSQHLLDQAEVS